MTSLGAPALRAEPSARPLVPILGVPIAAVSRAKAVEHIRGMIQSGEANHLVIANAHTLNLAHGDPAYRAVLARAAVVLRDGVGVELAARFSGQRLEDNFVGTDFVPALLGMLEDLRPLVFLYGAAPGVGESAARALTARCPGIVIAGVADGYGDPGRIADRLASERADILLVALGNPLQEQWIDRHLAELNVGVAIGVGALFDFLAGRVRRAPRWMRRMRCEWVFRLGVEPRRLWRRYVIGNPRFLWRVAVETKRSPS